MHRLLCRNFVILDAEVHRLEVELVKGHYVSGKVTDVNGLPVPDVLVRSSWTRSHAEVRESDGVMKVGRKNRFGWYFPQTQTSADGTFRLGPFEIATDGSIWADSPEFGSARVRGIICASRRIAPAPFERKGPRSRSRCHYERANRGNLCNGISAMEEWRPC